METYNLVIDPAWVKTYPYPPPSRKTMAVKCILSDKTIKSVSFLPAMINIDARSRFLSHEDEGFNDVVQYVAEITEKAGLNAQYNVEGDEVFISVLN